MNSTRNLFQYLPPPAECLAILIGTAELTIFGLGGLASPESWATGFGTPLITASDAKLGAQSSESTAQAEKIENTQRALIAACAARNVQNGLLLLTFGMWMRDRKALGVAVGLGVITTVTDYLVVSWYGVKEAAFGHVIGVGNCLLIGGSLLYWNRDDPWFFQRM